MAKRKWLNEESSVSKYLQTQRPITTDTDVPGYENHPYLSRLDTNDYFILKNLISDKIINQKYSLDFDNQYTVITEENVIAISEDESDYESFNSNDACILFDDRHSFIIDQTIGEERIFLYHSEGTYVNINKHGDWINKVTGSKKEFIYGEYSIISSLDFSLLCRSQLNFSANESINISASKQNSTLGSKFSIIGSEFQQISGNKIANIEGNYFIQSKGLLNFETIDTIILNAKKAIILKTPTIIHDLEKFRVEISGSSDELIGGRKKISADMITLTGTDAVNIGSLGNMVITVSGKSVEKITGVGTQGIASDLFSKKIEVATGHLGLTTILGSNIFKSGIGTLRMNPTGSLNFENPVSNFNVSEIGTINLSNAIGAITVSLSDIKIEHKIAVKLGEGATSSAILGTEFMQLFLTHIHPGPDGSTGPPNMPSAGEFTNTLSKRVFIGI